MATKQEAKPERLHREKLEELEKWTAVVLTGEEPLGELYDRLSPKDVAALVAEVRAARAVKATQADGARQPLALTASPALSAFTDMAQTLGPKRMDVVYAFGEGQHHVHVEVGEDEDGEPEWEAEASGATVEEAQVRALAALALQSMSMESSAHVAVRKLGAQLGAVRAALRAEVDTATPEVAAVLRRVASAVREDAADSSGEAG